MKSINSFLITYAAFIFLSTSILSFFNVGLIGVYLMTYAVEFYVATEMAPSLDMSTSRRNTIFAILFAGIFIAIVLQAMLSTVQEALAG